MFAAADSPFDVRPSLKPTLHTYTACVNRPGVGLAEMCDVYILYGRVSSLYIWPAGIYATVHISLFVPRDLWAKLQYTYIPNQPASLQAEHSYFHDAVRVFLCFQLFDCS